MNPSAALALVLIFGGDQPANPFTAANYCSTTPDATDATWEYSGAVSQWILYSQKGEQIGGMNGACFRWRYSAGQWSDPCKPPIPPPVVRSVPQFAPWSFAPQIRSAERSC